MNREQRAVIDWVIESLEQEPDVWAIDHYTATHPSGVTLWHANGYFGMSVSLDGWAGEKIGGVSVLSSLFGCLVPWRVRMCNRIRRVKNSRTPPVERQILDRVSEAG